MYDTVNISLTNKSIPNIDLISYLGVKLSNVSAHRYSNSDSITGFLKNLKCVVTKDKLQIKDNSICKFYHKHNFNTLSLSETKLIFEEITDLLNLPVYDADVTRIDLATNFIMPYDLSLYFNRLSTLSGFNRLEQSKGLYYNNSINQKHNSIQLVFYNKYAEYRDKNYQIPKEYINPNLLRYEMRYLRKLPQHLKQKDIKVTDLYNPVFYNKLLDNWYNTYQNITKITDINKPDFSKIKTQKDLDKIALNYFISNNGGLNEITQKINENRKIFNLSRKSAYDIREKIRLANSFEISNCKSNYITELDNKMKDFYTNYAA